MSSVRVAAQLLGSSLVAQAAALLATIFAASHATPSDFATYATVMSAGAVVSTVASLAAETRLPVVADPVAVAMLRGAGTALAGVLAVGVAVGVCACVVGKAWGVFVVLGALGCVSLSAMAVGTSLVIRRERQEILARGRLVQGFGNALWVVILMVAGVPPTLALTGAWAMSVLVGASVIWWPLRAELLTIQIAHREDFRLVFQQVRMQPFNNLVASLNSALPQLILPALGAAATAGSWAFLGRFFNAIVNTVFVTLGPLYAGGFSARTRDGLKAELRAHHRRWLGKLVLLAPLMLAAILVGVLVGAPMLGESWATTRSVLLPACLFFPTLLVWLPLSQTLILSARIGAEMVWTSVSLVVSGAALLSAPVLGGAAALSVWAGVQLAALVSHVALQRRFIGGRVLGAGAEPSVRGG